MTTLTGAALPWRLVALAALLPSPAIAHVKWFVPLTDHMPTDFVWYGLGDSAVQVWLAIAVLLVGASLYLDSHLPTPHVHEAKALNVLSWILRICTGLSLLLSAYYGSVIAPHYRWQGVLAQPLLVLEVIVGLLLFTPLVLYGAAGLMLLWLGVGLHFGVEIVEYINIAGVGLFLALHHFPDTHRRPQLQPYALPLLRVLTGIALITLGLSEKLLRPDYAHTFVETYMWNFMQNLGMASFSDRLFVLSAGTMEVVFGLILLIGTTTRLNILVVSGFMLTSNLAFLLEGDYREALVEIIGHMPIIATALLFLLLGSGQKWKLSRGLHRLALQRAKADTQ